MRLRDQQRLKVGERFRLQFPNVYFRDNQNS
jgi:hypothetical protein